MDAIIQFINQALAYIGNYILDVVDNLAGVIVKIYDQIKGLVLSLVDQIKQSLQKVIDGFWALIQPVIQNVQSYIATALKNLGGFVVDILNGISGFAYSAFQQLVAAVKSIADPIVAFVTKAKDLLFDAVSNSVSKLTPAVQDYITLVTAGIDKFTKESGEFVAAVNIKLTDIGAAFNTGIDKLVETEKQFANNVASSIVNELKEWLKPFVGFVDSKVLDEAQATLFEIFGTTPFDLTTPEGAATLAKKIYPTSDIGRAVFTFGASLFILKGIYTDILDMNGRVISQQFALQYHSQVLSPSDSAAAWMRGAIEKEDANINIVKQGFSPEDATRMLDNATSPPSVGDVSAMMLRGSVDLEGFRKNLTRLGFTPDIQEAYLELTNVIPGISDLITMAVKGAFSPEEIAAFRTDEDFPSEIVDPLKKQGLSEEWAKKYWRSHWNLPGSGQGFEMFQRGIIDDAKLRTLLKALDISPGWRDEVIKLSYNVLSRVDVRRLHQLGMLDHDGVLKAYKDHGYSPDDAEKLTIFTEALNKGKPGEADESLGRLSRTNVINFYQDGVITRDRAVELLVKIGYTGDAASLFIDTADFEAERVQRAAEIEFIIASATAGLLTFSAAEDEFNKLHLSPTELTRASAKLTREQTKATKLPTVEQGTKMFTSGAIPEAQFRDLLRRLGYRVEWADAFVVTALNDKKAAKGKTA